MNLNHSILRVALRSLALIALAGSLISVHTVRADEGDELGGPKVKDNSVPGGGGKLVKGTKGDKGEQARGASPRAFMRALESLKSDQTPAEVRLTSGQATQLDTIRADFESQAKAYRDANRAEIEKLREQVGPREQRRIDEVLRSPDGPREPREGRGQRGPKQDEPKQDGDMMGEGERKPVDEAASKAARERLKEIFDAAPTPDTAQAAAMGVLTEAQKSYVRDEMKKMASERMGEGRGEGKGRGEGERPNREQIEKMLSEEDREKLKGMSPEERREFIRSKMSQRREKGDKSPK
jgi:hypothetical protein